MDDLYRSKDDPALYVDAEHTRRAQVNGKDLVQRPDGSVETEAGERILCPHGLSGTPYCNPCNVAASDGCPHGFLKRAECVYHCQPEDVQAERDAVGETAKLRADVAAKDEVIEDQSREIDRMRRIVAQRRGDTAPFPAGGRRAGGPFSKS